MNERSHRRRAKLLILATSTVAALLVCEVGLRIAGYGPSYYNPYNSFHEPHELVGHRGKPNMRGRFRTGEFDALVAHNERGFRRVERGYSTGPESPRVLVFGDSFTWGWGVEQGSVVTDVMSRHLPGHRVYNFGLSGSGTVQQFALFETYGEDLLRPGDVVLLNFFGNDFCENVSPLSMHGALRDGVVVRVPASELMNDTVRLRLKNRLKDRSYVFNLASHSIDFWLSSRRPGRRVAPRACEDRALSERVTSHFLQAFDEAVRRRGARFMVARIPGAIEVGEAPPHAPELVIEERDRDDFFAIAEVLGLETLDLLPRFVLAKAADPSLQITFPIDRHWTPDGSAVAGRVLASQVLRGGAVPEVLARRGDAQFISPTASGGS